MDPLCKFVAAFIAAWCIGAIALTIWLAIHEDDEEDEDLAQ